MPDQRQPGPFDAETQHRQSSNTQPAVPPQAGQPGRRINLLKWALGCAGLGMFLCAGAIMFTLIVGPVIFRSLDGELQSKLVRRIPILSAFQPTVPFQVLPTIGATNPNALALLATPTASPVKLMTSTPAQGLSSGDDNLPTAVAAASTNTMIPPTVLPSETTVPATTIPATTISTTSAPATTVPARSIPPTSIPPTSALASDTPEPPRVVSTPTQEASPTTEPSLEPSQPPTQPPVQPTRVPPTLVPSPVPPTPTAPLPVSYHASGYKWVPQTWNNCGPANLTQALQPFGWKGDQKDAAAYLKPNREDKNVSPWQMVDFVNSSVAKKLPIKAIRRVAGDLNLIKRLLIGKFSVIMETGYDVANEGWMGHYLTVIGYDDSQRLFYGLDTYLGDDKDNLGYREDFDDLDRRWQQFNRLYMVIYPVDREGELAAILGPDADLTYNAQHALSVAKAEALARPNNQYAWFNVGSSFTMLGQYKEAATAFDQATTVGGGLPFRFLWYQFTPYEAYYNVGNYANVMALVSASLRTTTYVEETFYWRAMVEAAQGKTDAAIEDFKRVLQFNPNYSPASEKMAEVQNGSFKPPAVAQAGQ